MTIALTIAFALWLAFLSVLTYRFLHEQARALMWRRRLNSWTPRSYR